MLKKLIQQAKDPLYKNSFFIMLSSITNAGFGFFFWMIAARLYSAEDVGIATALLSSLNLIILFSRLGFDYSIIRFFPKGNKSRILSTSIVISTSFAILFGILFIAFVDVFFSKLHPLRNLMFSAVFLMTAAVSSVTSLTAQSFIALRRGELYFLQNLAAGSRILFLFFLTFLGAAGIFGSVSFAFLFVLILALLLIGRTAGLSLSVDADYVRESFRFSTGNYFASLFSIAPNQILPIMVLNLLGAEKAAYYYVAFAIAGLIFLIPGSMSASLFVEGSHGESLRRNVLKSLAAIAVLLTPAVVFICLFGDFILHLFGKDYVQAFELLRLFALSSFFFAVVSVYLAVKRVQMDVRRIILLNGLNCFALLTLSYLLIPKFDILGAGYAWIATYFISSLIVGYLVVKKERWI